MANANRLELLSDVLVKAAEYIEELEREAEVKTSAWREAQRQSVEREARELAHTLSSAVGQEVDVEVAKKLASMEDKQIKSIIKKLATSQDSPRLGSVRRKTSGVGRPGRDDAEQGFAAWILS
mgnify:CR=1 FL=1